MEAAALLAVAARRAPGGGAARVTDLLGGGGRRRIGGRGAGGGRNAAGRGGVRGAQLPALGDRQAFLRPRHGLGPGGHRLAQRGQIAGDLVEPRRGGPGGLRGRGVRGRGAALSSSRSSASSMPSRRWDTDRSRRVSRSMSAADGMFSAPMAASWACTAARAPRRRR